MRRDPVRPDPARARPRAGIRRPTGRIRCGVVLAAVAAVVSLSVGCVRPAADSRSPGPSDPGLSATADQQSATAPGGRSSGGESAPDGAGAPGGPVGEAGGGSAPGGPVGPGARPPGGGPAPAKKPGGNQAKGSPVKIPSFTEIGSPFTPELKGRIEAAVATACQEAGHDPTCLALSFVLGTPDARVCTFSGLSPSNGSVDPGTPVTVQLSGSEPCPTTDDNGGTGTGGAGPAGSGGSTGGGGAGSGTGGDGTAGSGGGGAPGGEGTAGGGGTPGGEGTTGGDETPGGTTSGGGAAGGTSGGDGSTGGSAGNGGGTSGGETTGPGSGTTGGTGAGTSGGGPGDGSGTAGNTSSRLGDDTLNDPADTGGTEVSPAPSGG
ncbi:hypothetical protein [Nocardia sp. MH4]|uniref:hypothetical protein n=1 Tax=Nocardia sp. MH4 TaxID=1768677 RepID=UPI001C4E9E73|nr:hypothetical protein [Nocardia sp. MH4]